MPEVFASARICRIAKHPHGDREEQISTFADTMNFWRHYEN